MSTMGLIEDAFVYGKGYEEIVAGTTPAAGASFVLPIAGQFETRAVSVVATLVTSATVATRLPVLTYDDGNGRIFSVNGGAQLTQAASLTRRYVWQLGRGSSETVGTDIYSPLQDCFLEPGFNLNITVGAIQAADQLSAIVLLLQRFPTGHRGYVEGDTPRRHAAHR